MKRYAKLATMIFSGVVLLGVLMGATDCGGPSSGGSQPSASPAPAAQGPQHAGNVNVFELFVRTFDCRPQSNPNGGCDDEVKGFMSGVITAYAGPNAKGGTSVITDHTTGQVTDTKASHFVDGYPARAEFTVDADTTFIYWVAHVDRLFPGARVRCDLYHAGDDLTKPGIQQIGGLDDQVNEGSTTTSGDAICGFPTGFPAPKIG